MKIIFKNSLISWIGCLLVSLQPAFGAEDDLDVVRQWTSFNPTFNRPAFHPYTKRLEIRTTSSDDHGNPTGANIKIYRIEEGQGGALAGAPQYENNYQLNGEERRFTEETYLGSRQEPFVITFRRYENLIRIGAWPNPNHYNFDLVTDFRVELVGRIESPGNTIRIFTAPVSNIDRDLLQAHTIIVKNGNWRDEIIQGLGREVAELRRRLDTPYVPLRGHFRNARHDDGGWLAPAGGFSRLVCTCFEGNRAFLNANEQASFNEATGKAENLNKIEITIPEDGVYSLVSNYKWKAAADHKWEDVHNPRIIFLQPPQSVIGLSRHADNKVGPACGDNAVHVIRNHPILSPGTEDHGSLNHTCFLRKGEQVWLGMYQGFPEGARYQACWFQLYIEKISRF